AEERDAGAAVRVANMVNPHFVSTRESWLHRRRTLPERAHGLWLVAEVDGEVVAQARAGLTIFTDVTDTGYVDIAVDEGFRRRGIGSALYERCESHAREIGAARLSTQFFESPAGLAFAQARAFEFGRGPAPPSVDPRTVDRAR